MKTATAKENKFLIDANAECIGGGFDLQIDERIRHSTRKLNDRACYLSA